MALGHVDLILVAVLLLLSGSYGYHRDEMYFRVLSEHPAWGYVDQPAFAPMAAKLSIAVFGDTLGIRVLPALAAAILVVLVTLITRELGGRGVAQILAALGTATGAYTFIAGHTLLTLSFDLPFWAAAILFMTKALMREQPRWWLAVGVIVGLATYNKHLIVMLVLGLAVGLVAVGPRRVLASPWLWGGALIAAALAVPNLLYQADARLAAAQDGGGAERGPGRRDAGAVRAHAAHAVRAGRDGHRRVRLGAPVARPAGAGAGRRLSRRGRGDADQRRPLRLHGRPDPAAVRGGLRERGGGGSGQGTPGHRVPRGERPGVGRDRAAAHPGRPAERHPVPAIDEVVRESIGWPEFAAKVHNVLRSLPQEDQAGPSS